MTEDEFLQALFARLPLPSAEIAVPPGDDCAGIRIGRGRILLAAVDQLVGGRHYLLDGPAAAKPEEVGRKLLARNLSDIAAMGGKPLYCLVGLGLSPRRDPDWLQRFFQGIIGMAGEFGVFLIGGDLAVTADGEMSSLTILGEAPEKKVIRRSGARPGDLLYATGRFGRSFITGHHLSFRPRCAEGSWLAGKGFARAMIDVSDGLLLDARRLCRSSGVGLRLDTDRIPRRTPETTLREALTDGEDYELLFAVPKRKAERLRREWPFGDTALTEIGTFTVSDKAEVCGSGGAPLGSEGAAGWDHLSTLSNYSKRHE